MAGRSKEFWDAKMIALHPVPMKSGPIAAATKAEDLRKETAAVAQIIEVFGRAKDYNEAMEKAIELFPKLNTDALQEKISQAIFLSGVVGRLSAQE